jgi:hypothetical protein
VPDAADLVAGDVRGGLVLGEVVQRVVVVGDLLEPSVRVIVPNSSPFRPPPGCGVPTSGGQAVAHSPLQLLDVAVSGS